MIEITLVNVSTEMDPSLIQIGPILSSARAICRFLKNFQKLNILRGPTKTCVESLLRLCSLGSLSASRLEPSLSNLDLRFRVFNGQPRYEACVARFETALEQEAPKSDQEDHISSEEACEARTEAPLQLGAKMSDVLEEPKMDPSANRYSSHSLGYGWLRDPKTIWHGLVTLLPLERLAGPKTRKGAPGKR